MDNTFTLREIQAAVHFMGNKTSIAYDGLPDSLKPMAELANPQTLDHGDLFVIASNPYDHISDPARHCELDCKSNAEEALIWIQGKLGFEYKEEPDNVQRSHSTLSLDDDLGQLAVTTLTPDNVIASNQPIVFFGGLFHGASVYEATLSELAKKMRAPIHIIDEPGIGGSTISGDHITAEHLDKAVEVAVEAFATERPIVLMAHSQMTKGVREFYFKNETETNSSDKVSKYVLIEPVPTEESENDLLEVNTNYWVLAQSTAPFGDVWPLFTGAYFFYDGHSDEDQDWLDERVRNEFMPVSWNWDAYLDIFADLENQPILHRAASDAKLEVVIGQNSSFYNEFDETNLEASGFTIARADDATDPTDHSAIAGPKANATYVDTLIDVIQASGNLSQRR